MIKKELEKGNLEKGSSDDSVVMENGTEFSITLESKGMALSIFSDAVQTHT